MAHKFYLAPLRGITDWIFRSVYEKHYELFDYMLAPFIPTIDGNRVKDCHIKDLLPCSGDCRKRLIPQIIGKEVEGFLLLSQKFADIGFSSVNWNLGCPAPRVAKKKRGSGLLPHKNIIRRFLDDVVTNLPLPLSVKVRLGFDSKDDLEKLIPVFNDYPLKELIIHPRTGIQLYDGTVDIDKFEICVKMSAHTVVYNGDICSADYFSQLTKRFPNINRWMIGRGLIKNPRLLKELRETFAPANVEIGNTQPQHSAQYDTRLIFIDDLLNTCLKHQSASAVLGRMKEMWRYLGLGIDDGGELMKKVIHCKSIDEYQEIISQPTLSFSTAPRAI